MGIRLLGRGQLELGTDAVQYQGESNSQGGMCRAIDVQSRMLTRFE